MFTTVTSCLFSILRSGSRGRSRVAAAVASVLEASASTALAAEGG